MISWSDQPAIAANLFNPAFFGEMIRRLSDAYVSESGREMPFVFAFLAPPLALYPDSNRTLKARSYDYLHTWVTANPGIRITLARRCRELAPHVRLGMMFAIAHEAIEISQTGGIRPLKRPKGYHKPAIDSSQYFVRCRTLGRWLARVDQVSNVFLMLGLGL